MAEEHKTIHHYSERMANQTHKGLVEPELEAVGRTNRRDIHCTRSRNQDMGLEDCSWSAYHRRPAAAHMLGKVHIQSLCRSQWRCVKG